MMASVPEKEKSTRRKGKERKKKYGDPEERKKMHIGDQESKNRFVDDRERMNKFIIDQERKKIIIGTPQDARKIFGEQYTLYASSREPKEITDIDQKRKKLLKSDKESKKPTSNYENQKETSQEHLDRKESAHLVQESAIKTDDGKKSKKVSDDYDDPLMEIFDHNDEHVKRESLRKDTAKNLPVIEIQIVGPDEKKLMRFVLRSDQKMGTVMNAYCTSMLDRNRRDHVRFFFHNHEIRWHDTPATLEFIGNDLVCVQMKTDEELEHLVALKEKTEQDEEKERWQVWREEMAAIRKKEKEEIKANAARKKKEKQEKAEKDKKTKKAIAEKILKKKEDVEIESASSASDEEGFFA